jgi:hypothetical protein
MGEEAVDSRQFFRPFMQPRGRKIPQLVNEYAAVHTVMLDAVPPVGPKRIIQSPIQHIPAGAKLLRSEAKRGSDGKNRVMCVFGIFHSCQQFVQASRNLAHPFDVFMNVPDVLLECMFDILTMGPVDISKLRLQKLIEWKQIRSELEGDERALHDKMPDHLKHLVRDKQFLLLKKLAQGIKWPDSEIHHEMTQGLRLVGKGTQSGVFKPEIKHASMTEELLKKAKFLRPLILGRIASTEPSEFLEELHDITESEAGDKRWLEGPFSAEQVGALVGREWIPVQRFAVKQKNKLRPIDNFAENRVNDAWECPEKIDLHALDQLTWIVSVVCKAAFCKGVVEIPLKTGNVLYGKMHSDWNSDNIRCELCTVDLKDAYKQFGIHEQDRNKAVVSLKHKSGTGTVHYIMNCMPFGASSSVHNFNRIARMIWSIGVVELKLPWVNYFDDYPLMTLSGIATSSMAAAKGMLKLLGISFAENKLEPFSPSAEILGVVVDCSQVSSGNLIYSMKESRRLEALRAIEEILQSGKVTPALLPAVLGRLQFADGQLAGRAGKLAMADIRSLGLQSRQSVFIDTCAKDALEILKAWFMHNEPKMISLHSDKAPVLVFTDGSYEPGECGEIAMVGGVLLDGNKPARVFGCNVEETLLTKWHAGGKEHLIGQVEMYAVSVARSAWKEILHNRRAILFIDNWPVLDCYIPGTAREKSWRGILLCIEKVDMQFPSQIWACRVPSESNVADPPSRGTLTPLSFLGECIVDEPSCPMTGRLLKSCLS